MSEAERLARAIYDTTAVDVANALVAGTLDEDDVPDELLTALRAEGIEPDDDPDDRLGWKWDGDEAVPDA